MISVSRKDYLLIPLIILFALEVCVVTYYKQPHFSQLTATFIFLVSGMLIAILPFLIVVNAILLFIFCHCIFSLPIIFLASKGNEVLIEKALHESA